MNRKLKKLCRQIFLDVKDSKYRAKLVISYDCRMFGKRKCNHDVFEKLKLILQKNIPQTNTRNVFKASIGIIRKITYDGHIHSVRYGYNDYDVDFTTKKSADKTVMVILKKVISQQSVYGVARKSSSVMFFMCVQG